MLEILPSWVFQVFKMRYTQFIMGKKSKDLITGLERTVMRLIFTIWRTINLIYGSKKQSKLNLMRRKNVIFKKQKEIFKLFPSSARSLEIRRDACIPRPPFIAGFVDKRRRKVVGNPFGEINGFPQIDIAVESRR